MQLYDTLAGRKKHFAASGNSVSMLLCGPTVYDHSHAGHARMLLFYDMVARYFRSKRVRVSAVVNITDIDQKIFDKAKASGAAPVDLAGRFIKELLVDLSSLGIDGFALARVSDHVAEARKLVTGLLRDGRAYSAGGNVYLDTAKIHSFGRMSRMTRQELEDCPFDISPAKRSQSDILLWNASENLGLAFDDDILGSGIPWWHVQDSSVAMASYAGSYDIHGGARELVYPHHESHLAQLQALTLSKNPVRFWTHVGLVRAGGGKMSKSLGNTITIRDLLRKYSANSLRLYFYSRHYRDDLNFSEKELGRFERVDDAVAAAMQAGNGRSKLANKFFKHIEDDFDTPAALKVLVEAARQKSADVEVMANIFGLRY